MVQVKPSFCVFVSCQALLVCSCFPVLSSDPSLCNLLSGGGNKMDPNGNDITHLGGFDEIFSGDAVFMGIRGL